MLGNEYMSEYHQPFDARMYVPSRSITDTDIHAIVCAIVRAYFYSEARGTPILVLWHRRNRYYASVRGGGIREYTIDILVEMVQPIIESFIRGTFRKMYVPQNSPSIARLIRDYLHSTIPHF